MMIVAWTAHFPQGVVMFFLKARTPTGLTPPGTAFSPVQIHLETLNNAGWKGPGVAVTLQDGILSAMFSASPHTVEGMVNALETRSNGLRRTLPVWGSCDK